MIELDEAALHADHHMFSGYNAYPEASARHLPKLDAGDQPPAFSVGCIAQLDSDDLIETLDNLRNLLGRGAAKFCTDALDGKCTNLADFPPRMFRQFRG